MLSKSVDSSARSTSSRIISSDKQKFANQSLDALKKNVKFVWGKEQEAAMQKIKAKIAESIMLKYPNPNRPFDIYPDASSKYAIG